MTPTGKGAMEKVELPDEDLRKRLADKGRRALTGLDAYSAAFEEDGSSLQDVLADFLTDAMHLCDDTIRADFERALSSATHNYECERRGE